MNLLFRAQIAYRNATTHDFHYITTEQLAKDTHEWIKQIPSDFDVVVAIPRSGLIVGSIIAGELGKPLSTPDNFCLRSTWQSDNFAKQNYDIYKYGKILLVDDSGEILRQFRIAANNIKDKWPELSIIKAVQYIHEDAKDNVDYYYRTFNSSKSAPRFDFNLMHTDEEGGTAIDLDGVLCEEWPKKCNREVYEKFLEHAKPYRIPIYECKAIITGRREKYREITEAWLRRYNVRYKKLYMLPDNARSDWLLEFKKNILFSEQPYRYIESDDFLAKGCAKTGIRCISLESGRVF